METHTSKWWMDTHDIHTFDFHPRQEQRWMCEGGRTSAAPEFTGVAESSLWRLKCELRSAWNLGVEQYQKKLKCSPHQNEDSMGIWQEITDGREVIVRMDCSGGLWIFRVATKTRRLNPLFSKTSYEVGDACWHSKNHSCCSDKKSEASCSAIWDAFCSGFGERISPTSSQFSSC